MTMREMQDRHEPLPEEPQSDLEANPEIDPEDLKPRAWQKPARSRVLLVVGILALLLLLAFLPPLISANRFRRRIAQSVSESLGRPVHMDSVTLNLLPLPGFTLQNFVVSEDPAFGWEPVIEARSVQVTLRVWPLWRRRVEFSRISLTEPSVNLVHSGDGRWNIESILLQASRIQVAPTEQAGVGDAPRFPYIEATGARVNVKMGLEKMPLAFTEADFALWLPQPEQWRLRLEGRPTRTDTAATDTGIVQVQGTLGKAAQMKDVPVDLTAEWRTAPLGGVSWVLLAHDAGLRGNLLLRASVQGTLGDNQVVSRLDVSGLRRADFVPQHALDLEIGCRTHATAVFHQLDEVKCGWPSEVLLNASAPGLTLYGYMKDTARPRDFALEANYHDVAANHLLDVLRVLSPRVSPDLRLGGNASGHVSCCIGVDGSVWQAATGTAVISRAKLAFAEGAPFVSEDVIVTGAGGEAALQPVALDLGAPQPAQLDGRLDANGYTLHLAGSALRSRLDELARALPQFGDGLMEALPAAGDKGGATPIRLDLTSARLWSGGQVWTAAAPHPAPARRPARRPAGRR